jgi:hypothetical protein
LRQFNLGAWWLALPSRCGAEQHLVARTPASSDAAARHASRGLPAPPALYKDTLSSAWLATLCCFCQQIINEIYPGNFTGEGFSSGAVPLAASKAEAHQQQLRITNQRHQQISG